jgi:hypothetical protein
MYHLVTSASDGDRPTAASIYLSVAAFNQASTCAFGRDPSTAPNSTRT